MATQMQIEGKIKGEEKEAAINQIDSFIRIKNDINLAGAAYGRTSTLHMPPLSSTDCLKHNRCQKVAKSVVLERLSSRLYTRISQFLSIFGTPSPTSPTGATPRRDRPGPCDLGGTLTWAAPMAAPYVRSSTQVQTRAEIEGPA